MKIIMLLSCLIFCSYAQAGSYHPIAKKTEAAISVADCLMNRYSGRLYNSSRNVSQNQIQSLIEAARRAPSCYNDQPWNFIICDKETNSEAYQRALQCLVEFNQNWAKNAPLLIIAIAGKNFHHNQQSNRWGEYDTGAAALSLSIQAAAIGLMAHQMGGFDLEKITKEFQIPPEFTAMSVIAVGYEEKGKDIAVVKSERIPAKENFFKGRWGVSVE